MHQKTERGARNVPHLIEPGREVLGNWDAVRTFVEVVKRGSFRAAAEALDLSLNTVRDRVSKLEAELNLVLLVRDVDGVRLTPDGETIFSEALQMEEAACNIARTRTRTQAGTKGEVRLTVTEGLGAYWLTPRLVEFRRANPGTLINVDAVVQSVDISRLKTDIAVQLRKPEGPDVVMRKLGRLHLVPFASPEYLKTYGTPKTIDEVLTKHSLVIQSGNDDDVRELFDHLFAGATPEIAVRTNVGGIFYGALSRGAGIGLLPTYAYAIGANVTPLDLPVRLPVDIWLAYHAEMKRTARMNALIDWIIQSFDPRRFPWFRDEFIHPRDLQAAYKGEPLTTLFAGFHARG